MKKLQYNILPFLVLWCISFPNFIACSQNITSEDNLASVSVSVSYGSKVLSLQKDQEEISCRYCFVSSSEVVNYSNRSSWNLLKAGSELHDLYPGEYTVYVDGYVNGNLTYTGSRSVVLNAGCKTDVNVNLTKTGSAKGTLKFDFSSFCDNVTIEYKNIESNEKSNTCLIAGNGSFLKTFTKEISVDPGSYELFIYSFNSGVQTGGQVLAVNIQSGETVTVNGSLDQAFTVNTWSNILSASYENIKVGESKTFSYSSNGNIVSCVWKLDGVVVSNSSVCTFKSTDGQKHRLDCYVNGNTVPYICNINSYYLDSVELTEWQVLSCFKNTDKIISALSYNGLDLLQMKSYPLVVSNTNFQVLSSIADLESMGVEITEADKSKLNTYKDLVIGKNAPLSVTETAGWIGQERKTVANTTLRNCYCFKNLEAYALYGCDSLTLLWVGDSVTVIEAHALGGTPTLLKSRTSFQGNKANISISDDAYAK